MSDSDREPSLHYSAYGILDKVLGFSVESASRFVEQECLESKHEQQKDIVFDQGEL